MKTRLVSRLAMPNPIDCFELRKLLMSPLLALSWSGLSEAFDFLVPTNSFYRSMRERRAAADVVVFGWTPKGANFVDFYRVFPVLLNILNFARKFADCSSLFVISSNISISFAVIVYLDFLSSVGTSFSFCYLRVTRCCRFFSSYTFC